MWHRLEPPQRERERAVPLSRRSPQMLLGFAGLAWSGGHERIAAALLVGWDCMLRTGEILQRRMEHIALVRGRAVLHLHSTESSKRTCQKKMVVVESSMANCALAHVVRRSPRRDLLLPRGAAHFRRVFHALCVVFGITFHVTPYSLRRGGATYSFLLRGSTEKCMLRGRWASSSSARIYLADAVATVHFLQLCSRQLHLASAAADSLRHLLGQ